MGKSTIRITYHLSFPIDKDVFIDETAAALGCTY